MKQNVGAVDRVIRVVIGLGLLSLFFVLQGRARWIGMVGLIPLLTAGIGFCPLYRLLGIQTCSVRSDSH